MLNSNMEFSTFLAAGRAAAVLCVAVLVVSHFNASEADTDESMLESKQLHETCHAYIYIMAILYL